MRRLQLLFLLMTPVLLQAQDMTGIWQGHFQNNITEARSSILDGRYRFEVQIAQREKKFEGVTYSYLSTYFYGKATTDGTVNPLTGKVLLQEGKLLEIRNLFNGDACVMTCFLQYTKTGNDEYLEGTYVSMNTRDSSNCGRGRVFLHKVATSDFYKEPIVAMREKEIEETKKRNAIVAPPLAVHHPATNNATAGAGRPAVRPAAKPTPKLIEPPSHPMARVSIPRQTMRQGEGDSSGGIGRKFPTITPRVVLDRADPVVKTITVNTNEVILNIYDDGEIDGDTVSVYLDNKKVISNAMLTDRPLIMTVHLDDINNYHELVLVAENEGTIPPNTSLMIVKAGDKEYEVRITTTEQKNAVVKFLYSK